VVGKLTVLIADYQLNVIQNEYINLTLSVCLCFECSQLWVARDCLYEAVSVNLLLVDPVDYIYTFL